MENANSIRRPARQAAKAIAAPMTIALAAHIANQPDGVSTMVVLRRAKRGITEMGQRPWLVNLSFEQIVRRMCGASAVKSRSKHATAN
jgi:hypothetical protein